MIIVANKKYYQGGFEKLGLLSVEKNGHIHIEYIGRNDGGSILQNNYLIGRDGTREEVLEKYDINLAWRMESDPTMAAYLEALVAIHKHGLILVLLCHCKPLGCHGDGVKRILESM